MCQVHVWYCLWVYPFLRAYCTCCCTFLNVKAGRKIWDLNHIYQLIVPVKWLEKSEKSGYRPQLVHKLLYAIVFYADAKHHVSLCKVQFWWEVIHMLERVRDLAFFALSKDELTQKQTTCVINTLPHQPDSPRWLIWTIMHKEAGRKAQSWTFMLLYAFRRIMWEANESAESSGSKDMISSSSYLA